MPTKARDLWRVYFEHDGGRYYTATAGTPRRALARARQTMRSLDPMRYRYLMRTNGGRRPAALAVRNLNDC